MFQKLITLLLFASLGTAMNLEFPLMKTVAWVSMMICNSRNTSLKVALKKTLDGKHSCRLCRHLSKLFRAENKTLTSLSSQPKGLDFLDFIPNVQATSPRLSFLNSVMIKPREFPAKVPLVPPPQFLLS